MLSKPNIVSVGGKPLKRAEKDSVGGCGEKKIQMKGERANIR